MKLSCVDFGCAIIIRTSKYENTKTNLYQRNKRLKQYQLDNVVEDLNSRLTEMNEENKTKHVTKYQFNVMDVFISFDAID